MASIKSAVLPSNLEWTKPSSKGLKKPIAWPKPIKILKVSPFEITAFWNTGEIRKNVFDVEKEQWQCNVLFAPLLNPVVFNNVKIIDESFAWDFPMLEIEGKFYVRDFDPSKCYKESILIKAFEPELLVANFLKTARLKAGLTQNELGKRTGYSSKYISKIERGVTDIQIGTLLYIVETGFGKSLKLSEEDIQTAA